MKELNIWLQIGPLGFSIWLLLKVITSIMWLLWKGVNFCKDAIEGN